MGGSIPRSSLSGRKIWWLQTTWPDFSRDALCACALNLYVGCCPQLEVDPATDSPLTEEQAAPRMTGVFAIPVYAVCRPVVTGTEPSMSVQPAAARHAPVHTSFATTTRPAPRHAAHASLRKGEAPRHLEPQRHRLRAGSGRLAAPDPGGTGGAAAPHGPLPGRRGGSHRRYPPPVVYDCQRRPRRGGAIPDHVSLRRGQAHGLLSPLSGRGGRRAAGLERLSRAELPGDRV